MTVELISLFGATQIAKSNIDDYWNIQGTDKPDSINRNVSSIENTLHAFSASVMAANDRISKVEGSGQFITSGFHTINICDFIRDIHNLYDENGCFHIEVMHLPARAMSFKLLFFEIPDQGQYEDIERDN